MMRPVIDGAGRWTGKGRHPLTSSGPTQTLLRRGTGPRPLAASEGRRSPMRAYELMVIFDGDLDEPAAQAWTKTVVEQVSARGGRVHGAADWWGKRRFAYEIKHKTEGYYAVFNLTAEPG